VPPLNYDFVKKIKKEFPKIQFILNGGIESITKAHKLSKEHDGVMLGRLIQNNPFCLSQVDKLFYNYEKYTNINENIILDYFNYIKPRIENDSIFRLLSPLLQIFFGIPDSKKFKTEIHNKIKNKKIDELEFLFLKFVNQQNELIY
jgi:tRNA-dihydrouridine synthase A